ncbi:MAG TPA: FtsW/RodA/SpoVE family cell cycle protein [Candidatus Limnocylindria bacterium]|nr:FtsW/RodA/SpoVE family cell cycle protein [Candidatus Limnocylindria bacterium]
MKVKKLLRAARARTRDGSRAMTAVSAVFFACGFLLLGLKDWDVGAFMMAALVPMALMLVNRLLARLIALDRLLMGMVNFLCALGILVLYRKDPALGLGQAANYAVGLGGMALCLLLMRWWGHLSRLTPLIALGSLLLMALPVFFGVEKNGAKAWLSVGGFGFQPSELVKVALLLIMATLLSRRKTVLAGLFALMCLGMLMLQKDLGTALLYYATALVLLFVSTGSLTLLAGGVAGSGVGAYIGYAMFAHVKRRVAIWQDPWEDFRGAGYQIVQSLVAMANGGLWGTGLGLGDAHYVIPEAQTDFIFAIILNEFGALFGLMVVALYILMFLRGIGIALAARGKFHTLLALGCTCLIALQAFVIIGGNIKLIPLTGVTLPFVSYGGTSLVSSLCVMGLLQGVANANAQGIREDSEIAELEGVLA